MEKISRIRSELQAAANAAPIFHGQDNGNKRRSGEISRDICLGRSVQAEGTVVLPFIVTGNTTVGRLLKHVMGKEIIGNLMKSSAISHEDQTDTMGEGSECMMQGMMMGIQLGTLISYGRITRKQLKELIKHRRIL